MDERYMAKEIDKQPTIVQRLQAAEDEIKHLGGELADQRDQIKALYVALGIPLPPSPDRDYGPRAGRVVGLP